MIQVGLKKEMSWI